MITKDNNVCLMAFHLKIELEDYKLYHTDSIRETEISVGGKKMPLHGIGLRSLSKLLALASGKTHQLVMKEYQHRLYPYRDKMSLLQKITSL